MMTDTPLQKIKNLEQENRELKRKLRDYEKLIETGLTRSEKKYQLVLDSSADSICIIQDGIVKYINKSLLKASGLSEKELLGKPFDQFIMPEERPTVLEYYKKRMAGLKVPNSYESRARIGGGKIADIEINVSLTTHQGKKAEQITVRDITEKKKTEENLRIYEKILSVTNDLMAYIDSNYRYQAVNDAYLTFHNIKREEIIGTMVSEIMGEQVYKEVIKEKMDHCLKGETINYQHWFNYKNRGKKYMNVTYYPVYDKDNSIMGIVSSVNDITRVKKIEEEIRETQVRYKNLFDNAPIPIWEEDFSEVRKFILKLQQKNIKDVRKYFDDHPEIISQLVNKTNVIDINNETLNLYNAKSKEDLLGNLDKTFLPESLNIFTDAIIALIEGKNNFEDETIVKTLDGKILDVIFKMFTLETHVPDNPQHIAYVSTIDISERKKAEETLEKERKKFKNILDSFPNGIYIVDKDFNIEYINKALEIEFGPVNDRKCHNYFYKRKSKCPWCQDKKVFNGESVRWQWISPVTNKTYDLYDTPIENSDGSISKLAVFHDITDLKQIEKALQESEKNLKRAQSVAKTGSWKLDLKNDHISVSDEIYTVLGIARDSVISFESFLEKVHPDDEMLLKEAWENAIAGHLYDVQYRIMKDGKTKWLRTKSELQDSGEERTILGTTQDITDYKLAEEALKVSEERFRSFIEQASEGIYLFELEKPIPINMPLKKQIKEAYIGRIVECNNAMAKMYGYSRAEDLIGLTLNDLHGSDDHPDNIEFITAWIENNYRITHAISSEIDKNGNPVWFSNNVIGIVENGLLIRIWGTQTDITEQRQAQEALRISEEKFSRIFKSSPDAITLTSVNEGKIIEANDSLFQLTGYKPEELIGKNTIQLDLWITDKDRDRYIELLKKYGKVRNFEADFKIKNGEIRTGLISGELINLHDGTYILGIIRDITDRKNAQKALKQSEEFNRKIVESSISGIYILDLTERKRVFLNPTATKLTGYTLEELQKRSGKKNWEYVHPDDRNMFLEHMEKISRSKDGEIFQYEYRYKHKKGNWIWLESWDTVFARDKKGNVTQLIGSFQDITERVKAKEALQESEKRYKILAENTNDVIWTMNASGHFTYVSPAIEKLRGFTADEVYKQNLEDVLTPGSLEIVNEALSDFFSKLDKGIVDQSPSIFELEQIRKDGSTIWTEVVSNNISDENGNFLFFLGVTRDISERKEAEIRIRKLNTELEQRVKERTAQLEASNNDLEAFAYSVSHDLRAPLRHIDGFSRLLYNQLKNLPPDGERYFTKITDSSRKMHRMIDDLLTFSRLGKREINKTLVNLDFLMKEIVNDYKHEMKNRNIQWKISALGIVEGDRNLLKMVFENLISNAIKFTANRQKSLIEISKKRISHDFIEIMVKDNGVGFDMKYAHKLFNVFQRLHNSDDFEGTGIGLANVKRIIQRHGGNVKAEGKENQGAVFYILLPNKN